MQISERLIRVDTHFENFVLDVLEANTLNFKINCKLRVFDGIAERKGGSVPYGPYEKPKRTTEKLLTLSLRKNPLVPDHRNFLVCIQMNLGARI